MHKLLDINEQYIKDINMHYSQAILFDTAREQYMLVEGVSGRDGKVLSLAFYDVKKEGHVREYSFEEFNSTVKAVSLSDGYLNLNGYAVHIERSIERKFKKSTTIANTALKVLGQAYVRLNNKRVKNKLDAYTCYKALDNRYYTFDEGIKQLDKMFSVALSPCIALVKQPVQDESDRVHVVYHDVYLGEVKDGIILFEDPEVRELVIDQIKELGYAA